MFSPTDIEILKVLKEKGFIIKGCKVIDYELIESGDVEGGELGAKLDSVDGVQLEVYLPLSKFEAKNIVDHAIHCFNEDIPRCKYAYVEWRSKNLDRQVAKYVHSNIELWRVEE